MSSWYLPPNYKCANAKHTKTCKKKTVRKEWLEDLVVAETMKLIQDDAVINAIVSEVLELQEQENTTLPLLEKQMKEVENSIENMLNAIQAGVLTSSTKARLEKLEEQQKELEVRIAEEKIAKPRLSENQIRFWLIWLRKLDTRVKSHRETFINTFVNAVYFYDEKVLIIFNYKDGTKPSLSGMLPPLMPQRAMVRIWLTSLHHKVSKRTHYFYLDDIK